MTLPSRDEIKALHKKYALDDRIFKEIWEHCLIVEEMALWCVDTNKLAVDRDLVSVGALLHDLGNYRMYAKPGKLENPNYITHGVVGYKLLKEEGFDEVLCRIASHHTGVGITKEEIIRDNLPLPPADYLAETPEQRVIMYADKFHSKDPSRFNSPEWFISHVAAKFGEEKIQIFEGMVAQYGLPPYKDLAERYKQIIR